MSGSPRTAISRKFSLILKVAVSVGLVFYCLESLDVARLKHLLENANIYFLSAACLVVVVEVSIGAYRFKLMLDPSRRLSFGNHLYQYFGATFYNMVLPTSVGGDALRVMWLGSQGLSRLSALGLILFERYTGLLTLMLVALVALPFSTVPPVISNAVLAGTLLCIASMAILVLAYRWMTNRPRFQSRRALWFRYIDSLLEERGTSLAVIAVALLYQYLTVGITFIVAKSFAIDVTLGQVLVLVPLVWVATLIPISLGGLGVREVSFIYLFAHISIAKEEALILAFGTYLVLLFSAGLGGLFRLFGLYWWGRESRSSQK